MRRLAIATAFLLACGSLRYAYAPVMTTSAEVDGHAAALVVMPPDAPKGELRIASLGVANVTPPPAIAAPPFRALFVRFIIDNQSDEEWTFDQAEQRIDIDERGEHTTSWASTATADHPPVVRIPARNAIGVDLLFSVGKRDEGALSRFEVLWTVRPGSRAVSGRTGFARQTTTREAAPAAFKPEAQ